MTMLWIQYSGVHCGEAGGSLRTLREGKVYPSEDVCSLCLRARSEAERNEQTLRKVTIKNLIKVN